GIHLSHLVCDIALVSRQYEYLHTAKALPERRLYQALAVQGVQSVAPVYIGQATWKHPWTRQERTIMMIGFPPHACLIALACFSHNRSIRRISPHCQFARWRMDPVR